MEEEEEEGDIKEDEVCYKNHSLSVVLSHVYLYGG